MDPKTLLTRIRYLNDREGETVTVSDDDAVYLKLTYNIDTSILKKRTTPYLYNSLRFVYMVIGILKASDLLNPEGIDTGYLIVSNAPRRYPLFVYMNLMTSIVPDYDKALFPSVFRDRFYYNNPYRNGCSSNKMYRRSYDRSTRAINKIRDRELIKLNEKDL